MGPASGNHWFDRTATLPETALRQGLLFSWFFGCLGIASGTREQVLTEAVELRLLRGGTVRKDGRCLCELAFQACQH